MMRRSGKRRVFSVTELKFCDRPHCRSAYPISVSSGQGLSIHTITSIKIKHNKIVLFLWLMVPILVRHGIDCSVDRLFGYELC
jgi:hypothetical protein